jgi:hypothetical protein
MLEHQNGGIQMGRPSIYSKDYYKIMRRRRRIFRISILLTALIVIFFTYNKSFVPNLKKLADGLKLPVKDQVEQMPEGKPVIPDSSIPKDSGKDVKPGGAEGEQGKPAEAKQEEYVVKAGISGTVTLLLEQKDGVSKFTGVKGDNSYSISEDGKFIVFDYPITSDIWICGINGEPKKLNTDIYRQSDNSAQYSKASIMEQYGSNYIWASKPVFIKDGRIVYQSNLPWFKKVNSFYLWVVDSEGKSSRYVLPTDQTEPVKYSGFTDSGELIIESGGLKYAVDIDKRVKREIN